ncbi:MAG: hypothetical protein QXU36_08440 [Thermofilum sp.]|uniref:hypothetical protein n=1 Tax=Thermofilum sp. TaxID=1961369 RepID=UPI0031634416
MRNKVVPSAIRAHPLSLMELANSLVAMVLAPIIVQVFPTAKPIVAGILIMLSTSFLVIIKGVS